jgi:hypothetical protein
MPARSHPDAGHAVGEPQRLLVRRGVEVRGRIEQDEVGAQFRLDPASVASSGGALEH